MYEYLSYNTECFLDKGIRSAPTWNSEKYLISLDRQ